MYFELEPLAQSVEHLTFNQRVEGSNPFAGTIFLMAVVAKWLTHRIVAPAFVGSIPTGRPFLNFNIVIGP